MTRERTTVSGAWLCLFFEKSRQAYYQVRRRQDKASVESEVIIDYVKEYREEMSDIGTRKLHHLLQAQFKRSEIKCGRDKLFSILGRAGLLQRRHRAKRCMTQSMPLSRNYPNLIKDMAIVTPEQVWVSDTTGILVRDGLGYLTLTTDAYSRRIMGYNAQRTKQSSGSLATLRMALSKRCYPCRHLIHHSDGGSEYFNHAFMQVLGDAHVQLSCTAPSSPQENAIAERINGILKNEFHLTADNRTFEEVLKKLPVAVRIYNERRPHTSIDFMTPAEAHYCIGPLHRRWKTYRKHRLPTETILSDGEQGTKNDIRVKTLKV
jgi:transposase InsO family protein